MSCLPTTNKLYTLSYWMYWCACECVCARVNINVDLCTEFKRGEIVWTWTVWCDHHINIIIVLKSVSRYIRTAFSLLMNECMAYYIRRSLWIFSLVFFFSLVLSINKHQNYFFTIICKIEKLNALTLHESGASCNIIFRFGRSQNKKNDKLKTSSIDFWISSDFPSFFLLSPHFAMKIQCHWSLSLSNFIIFTKEKPSLCHFLSFSPFFDGVFGQN